MKLAIMTFQKTNNYGGILQNFALQKSIEKLGFEVETINYVGSYIEKPYRIEHLKNKGLKAYLFGVAGYVIYLFRGNNNRKFKKRIKYTKPVTGKELKELNNQFDYFVTGSDQVWNYKLTGDDDNFFLGFVEDKKKCISYAASLGLGKIDEDKYYLFHDLYSFGGLSTREISAKNEIQKIIDKEIEVVCDPCLLLSKSMWNEIIKKNKYHKEYVFVYQLGFSPDVVCLAKKIAKKYRISMVFAPFPVGRMACGKWDFFAGAGEILSYISNARFVVTDSFHGTIFSIIFEKQFYTKAGGTHSGVGNRIVDLLTHYNLQDRIISGELKNISEIIDYSKVSNILELDRIRSLDYLEKCLKSKVE